MLPEQQNLETAASLGSQQLQLLQQATQNYSPLQLAWASGYLAAKSEQTFSKNALSPTIVEKKQVSKVTILYASQTGNAKGVAKELAQSASAAGCEVNLLNIADYKAKNLKNEHYVIIIASTNGEGEPPDDALAFYEFLLSKKAPKLPDLHYSVLALGDSSYEYFCQTGKVIDERLKALGAKAISERIDCDVDYQDQAKAWSSALVTQLKATLTKNSSASDVVDFAQPEINTQYSKVQPYEAELSVNQKITGRDSLKSVHHIEIDLGDSALQYQAGDALGVYFENDLALVTELLTLLGFSGEELITLASQQLSLKEALIGHVEITKFPLNFITFWAEHTNDPTLVALLSDKSKLRDFANNHQLVDVLRYSSKPIAAQVFIDQLRKITPRLYSIASSQSEVENEVHLTVGLVKYQQNDKTRYGAASGFLINRLNEGDKVKVFVEENNNFRLPANTDEGNKTPIIMIAAGTGIAPFRAFMQEREARLEQGASLGKSWLFFGEQTFTQDFLYQVEWQNYLKSGLLTKMDVAFSRDQQEKVYVQHRLKAQAQTVYQWLDQGAHLYLCGDANRMAKDVHQALISIICEQGKQTVEQAENYLKKLRSEKRYQKDVY
jgi:sulfite reductase (NADPH) flavoprotein alpha-component